MNSITPACTCPCSTAAGGAFPQKKSKYSVSNIMAMFISLFVKFLNILDDQHCSSPATAMSSYIKATSKTPRMISYMSVI